MRKFSILILLSLLCAVTPARAGIFGQVHGVVHDPQHRPIAGAKVELRARNSDASFRVLSAADGSFFIPQSRSVITPSAFRHRALRRSNRS